jgi:hypothetical protein
MRPTAYQPAPHARLAANHVGCAAGDARRYAPSFRGDGMKIYQSWLGTALALLYTAVAIYVVQDELRNTGGG